MPMLPFDEITIETALTRDEAVARLASAVQPRRFFRRDRRGLPFEGEVNAAGFHISRAITHRNSFLPVIRGRVVSTAGGSRLEASLTLHTLVIGFLCVWGGLLVMIGAGMWARMLESGTWGADALVPVGMLAFAWVITSVSFTVEARKARALLGELLSGDERSANTHGSVRSPSGPPPPIRQVP
ncbi:MAG TPA: hypothetical protein VJ650_12245 [Gemmatimonadaceae bacterium]|nr:hypothetical protein [Gemmatimonadaceae bacterium]